MKKDAFKILKKTLTIALSILVLVGAVCGGPVICVSAAEHPYESDTVLAEHNYDDATIPEDSWVGGYFNYSCDVFPERDPDDASNTVLRYNPHRTAVGLALLGHDYVSSTVSDRIIVEAGVTYKVEFELYTQGETGLGFGNMGIGLAVGPEGFEGKMNETNYSQFLSSIVELATFREYSTLEEGWNNYTGYISIPEDADVTTNNFLYIYFRGAGFDAYAYLDNVKVTALAGVTVDYVIGDNTVSVYYSDGNIPTELPEGIAAEDEDGNALKLYTDSEHTTTFSAEGYERTGEQAKVTLYGTYKKPSSVPALLTSPETYVVLGVVVVAVVAVVIIVAKAKKKK